MMTDEPAKVARSLDAGPMPARRVGRDPSPAPVSGAAIVTAMAEHLDWRVALDRAVRETMKGASGPPDLVVVFASSAWAADYPQLIAELRASTCAATIVGCSASGAIGNGCEAENAPAISLLAGWMPFAVLQPVRLTQEHLAVLDEPDTWESLGDVDPAVRAWLVFSEPFRFDVQTLLDGLTASFPNVPVLGGLTSGGREERKGWVFLDGQIYDEGAVALAIGGDVCVLPMVAHGGDPIGEAWTVTGAERNVIATISNRSAVAMMQDALATLPPERQAWASRNLVLGFATDEYRDDFHRGDFLMRGVIGVDEAAGTLTIGGIPRVGQTVQFHIRDGDSATIDLMQSLTDMQAIVGDRAPLGGVVFDCVSRGVAMFGEPHHDAALIRAALGEMPVMGGFVSGEIGPAGRRNGLHAFTTTMALLVHDPVR
ncbi:MAG: FIST N-terminal domain-containing protein [Thermomicrobiales bacterium]